MIQEQRVILKSIGYGEEGSYNDIVAKDHSKGTARWPIWARNHSQGTTAPSAASASYQSVQRSISLEYQICPSRHTIWYSNSGNGPGSSHGPDDGSEQRSPRTSGWSGCPRRSTHSRAAPSSNLSGTFSQGEPWTETRLARHRCHRSLGRSLRTCLRGQWVHTLQGPEDKIRWLDHKNRLGPLALVGPCSGILVHNFRLKKFFCSKPSLPFCHKFLQWAASKLFCIPDCPSPRLPTPSSPQWSFDNRPWVCRSVQGHMERSRHPAPPCYTLSVSTPPSPLCAHKSPSPSSSSARTRVCTSHTQCCASTQYFQDNPYPPPPILR